MHSLPAIANRQIFPSSASRSPTSRHAIASSPRHRFFTERRQKTCQRRRQLGADEEPHDISLSDEDRMVEILGGVL
jgi:hypothetical protein